ncbi:O-antigen ligase family protein [Orenia marismortui]|uniref:Putative inorganic carbon (HCO3(-)) transporter n=1 Tax=Orenia marismortui TaxID=46469 RepID=A0A4V3GY90_9FIRM|nr:O-antigen ligase family protein [Orenia marismortui]TDX50931.1 putative inorganic carbon (HCO3(-)) transporter [Orenia marismortui]
MLLNNFEEKLDLVNLGLFILAIAAVPLIYLSYTITSFDFAFYELDGEAVMHIFKDTVSKPKIYTLLIIEVIMLLNIYLKIKLNKFQVKWRSVYLSLSIFLSLIFVSVLLSPYKITAIYGKSLRSEGFLAWLAYVLIFFLAINVVDSKKKIKKVTEYLLASATIVSIYGILQYYGVDPLTDPRQIKHGFRAFATFGNPDFAGSYIAMLFPFSFILYFYAKNKNEVLILGAITTLFYGMLIATGTRSAYLGVIVVAILILYLIFGEIAIKKKRLFYLLILLICVTFIFNITHDSYFSKRLLSIFSDGITLIKGSKNEVDKVGSLRMFIYKTSIPLLAKNPLFGSGPDTFHLVYPLEKYSKYVGKNQVLDKAHCEYLQIAITMGIPALLAYLWFLSKVLIINFRVVIKRDKYQLAFLVAIVSYLIQATFNISVVSVAPVFWAIMGLSISQSRYLRKRDN